MSYTRQQRALSPAGRGRGGSRFETFPAFGTRNRRTTHFEADGGLTAVFEAGHGGRNAATARLEARATSGQRGLRLVPGGGRGFGGFVRRWSFAVDAVNLR